jgi:tetratricopeptide (TPR) repeat protein
MRRCAAFVSVALAVSPAAAQQPRPTPARASISDEPSIAQPKGSQPRTTAQALAEVYERTKTAKTADEFGEIIEPCERILSTDPPEKIRKYAHDLAAWGYNRRGEVYAEQAARLFDQGSEREANELDALALDDFQAAVQHDPVKWKALHNRGVSLALHGRVEEALADFDEVIRLQPGYANAHFNRAEIRANRGDFAAAVEDYSQSLKLKPDDVGALVGRGLASLRLKQTSQAKLDFDRALTLAPKNAAALCGRADVAMAEGEWNQAGADYRQAIKLDPRLGRAYRGVAWLLATCPVEQFRNAELAIDAAERALEIDAADWANLDALAAAQASAGKYDEAVATLERALEAAPEEATAALHTRLSLYRAQQPYRQSERAARRTISDKTR